MKSKKKWETSKVFLFIITTLSIIITFVSIVLMLKFETTDPLCYLIPSVFTELSAATVVYYIKARTENKVKIILGAIKQINKEENLTDEETRIIESLINNINE